MSEIVRIPIDKARAAGRYDAYAAVAVEETPTHLRVRRADWLRISGRSETAPKPRLPLGDWAEKAISVATLGQGKRIAQGVAKAMGKSDCGCARRKAKLNALGERVAGVSRTRA